MSKHQELQLIDLGEVSADTARSISTGKFEISTGKFEILVQPKKSDKKR
jgi:hypothetical protein